LAHFYSPADPEKWILGLTLAQFNARVKDVYEVQNLLQGEGKGRVVKERHDSIQQRFNNRGLKPPPKVTNGAKAG